MSCSRWLRIQPPWSRSSSGPDGASETIAPEATLIDMSTVGPTAIRAAAKTLDPVACPGTAPVLGSVPHAKAGTLALPRER